jgi:hypothetical protein
MCCIPQACRHCILFFEANDKDGVCNYSGPGPNKYCSKLPGSTIQIATQEANAGIKHWKVRPQRVGALSRRCRLPAADTR